MAQALHFHLTGVGEGAGVDELAGAGQELLFLGAANLVLELVADIEVVFQRALAPAGHDRHVLQTGVPCFFNGVLDQWLVDDRQHFLGHGFGCRQETRAIAGSGEQAFTNHKNILDSHGTQRVRAITGDCKFQ
ncbi:hypothetical protein D3C81_1543850 [compost metagenome]